MQTTFAPVSEDAAIEAYLTGGVIGPRIAAWLVDLCLIAVVATAGWVALFTLGIFTLGLAMPLLTLIPFVPVIYGAVFIASPLSATPGQALFGLVVRRNEDLGDPGLLRAFATTALFYVTWWGSLLIQILAILPIAGRNRMLHDVLSGTVVVHAAALRNMTLTRRPYVSNMTGFGISGGR